MYEAVYEFASARRAVKFINFKLEILGLYEASLKTKDPFTFADAIENRPNPMGKKKKQGREEEAECIRMAYRMGRSRWISSS